MPDLDGLVDVHAHFTTGRYVEAAEAAGHREPDGMPEAHWPRWNAAEHLELMERVGGATAMLSISSPGVHSGDLGAAGVVLMSNSRGAYLGDERLAPMPAELDRRRAAVFLHPTSAVGHEHVDCGRPRPMMEFLFDTARSVVDFVLSGHAERYPGLRPIVPHMGGVLPLLAVRAELFRPLLGDTGDGPSVTETLRRFHYDLAGAPNAEQLAALASIAPPEHLLYGSDYAWTPAELLPYAASALDSLIPGGTWRERTARNARALFGR
ncbi:amidohydrolase family protein [Actinomadura sp. DC4]|uniref:amidohydrolase family protein n=1 Tax=Actinomadura sp. DC4 TaxID=3055069 RepID=UPI0025AF2956|nr:amidohydrolase family protein [Actinomadura sp. DC4]MDN3355803.1 amidohydrolase family protein [Actinomadura sp. DC4]